MPDTESQNLADLAWKQVELGDLINARETFTKVCELDAKDAEAWMMIGTICGELGQINEATRNIQKAIQLDPEYADAYLALVKIQISKGENEDALQNARKATELDADYAEAWATLGSIYASVEKYEEAETAALAAIAINPNLADAQMCLGIVFEAKSLIDNAIMSYQRVVELTPGRWEAHYRLGNIFQAAGNADSAINHYQAVNRLNPDNAEAQALTGMLLIQQDKITEAKIYIDRSLEIQPDLPIAIFNRGLIAYREGDHSKAIKSYNYFLTIQPENYLAICNLALALSSCGRYQEAVTNYEHALELEPDSVEVHNNLGNLLRSLDQTDKAVSHLERAQVLAPDNALVNNNLGNLIRIMGRLDDAITYLRRAIELQPTYTDAHNNLLFTLNNSPSITSEDLFNEHLKYGRQHAEPITQFIQQHSNDKKPERRLRIGYVSGDFREHSIAYFIRPVLQNHDHQNFELFAYYNHERSDSITESIQHTFENWRPIAGMTDEQVTQLVCRDKIDILIDLSGHTAHNRLLVFARKAAPVQVTWLGYPTTTGLSAIDYRITDNITDPAGSSEHYYTEQLFRLPECFSIYQPPMQSPDVGELPAIRKGYITFGSFNNLAKTHPAVLSLWAKILTAIPESRLILKCRGMDVRSVQQSVHEVFTSMNVARDRVELLGRDKSTLAHMQQYNRIDIGLDPFPYNGTTTTCEATWMGVPVITLKGDRHAGRVGTSLMYNLGLAELVANNQDDYVNKAVKLASDPNSLQELRSGLRNRMKTSSLMDAERFTRQLETAYRDMWMNWCLTTGDRD